MKKLNAILLSICLVFIISSCKDDSDPVTIHDPATAEKVSVDRFSAAAGHLQVRTSSNGLPAANAAVNFDQGPFITKGLGPSGQVVEYYNFDIQPATPAPIWVLFKEGETTPVSGQMNIIDVLPGEAGYNDFWQVIKVTVPSSYQANQVASYQEIVAAGYKTEATTSLVNCPVVPEGSVASKRFTSESKDLIKGWYKDKVVFYFSFTEKDLVTTAGKVPVSPIYVCFNIDPNANNPASGPASGFKSETGSTQTHNVIATIPSDASYSPLWTVNAFTSADFDKVSNLTTAQSATSAGTGLGLVNCPVISIK